jgi:hypothetical protein
MRRADASGSTGNVSTRPAAPLDDWSTPALAHTNPWRVSVINTGPIWRTIRTDSLSTTSTTRASLSHCRAHSLANVDGSTSASSIAQPSAFDTIFDVTTTTSPSTSNACCAISAARSAPGSISGSPSTGTIISGPATGREPTGPIATCCRPRGNMGR